MGEGSTDPLAARAALHGHPSGVCHRTVTVESYTHIHTQSLGGNPVESWWSATDQKRRNVVLVDTRSRTRNRLMDPPPASLPTGRPRSRPESGGTPEVVGEVRVRVGP